MGSAAGSSGPAQSNVGRVSIVRVTAQEFSFALSRTKVPTGMARFIVTNAGMIGHDFYVDGQKTRVLAQGRAASLLVRFRKPGRYAYRCSVPGHAAVGMKGVLVVGRANGARGKSPPAAPPPPAKGLTLTKVATFTRPVFATSPPGDEHRLFVVEQAGVVRELVDGVPLDQPFLDISDRVQVVTETGLLSLAFAPDYANSGLFYVFFNDNAGNHNIHVVEFRRSAANPNVADLQSYREVLTIQKPWESHNGGMMKFGPDGYLYISVGDGGRGYDAPFGAFAQTLDDLLGNILRIDPTAQPDGAPYRVPSDNPFVGVDHARPEIWAYGLRNPWRFDIDSRTGDLYLGDVGEGVMEEIDLIPGGRGGQNFGWPCFEGTATFSTTSVCPNSVPPLLAYEHAKQGCSVTGGVIAHDPRLPQLAGRFLYGDFCNPEIHSVVLDNGRAVDGPVGASLPQTVSFGEDGLHRIYLMSLADQGPLPARSRPIDSTCQADPAGEQATAPPTYPGPAAFPTTCIDADQRSCRRAPRAGLSRRLHEVVDQVDADAAETGRLADRGVARHRRAALTRHTRRLRGQKLQEIAVELLRQKRGASASRWWHFRSCDLFGLTR